MRVPKYRRQRKSKTDRGRGFVEYGGKRHYFPGAYQSAESMKAYRRFVRLLAEEMDRGSAKDNLAKATRPGAAFTIAQAVKEYLDYVHSYRTASGRRWPESYHVDRMAYCLLMVCPDLPLDEFTPRYLKKVRHAIAKSKRLKRCKELNGDGQRHWVVKETDQPLTRKYVNEQISRVKRFLRWAVAEELVSVEIVDALGMVAPLKKSRLRSDQMPLLREGCKVKPADPAAVERVLAELSPVIRHLGELHQLTGMRPSEICSMRPADIDCSNDVWEYRPREFKTDHGETEKIVFLGPRAQQIVRKYLDRGPDDYLFSPKESRLWYNERRWNGAHTAKRKPPKTGRSVGDRFTANAYRQAVVRVATRLGVKRWFPYQLRHTYGTVTRKKYGAESARVAMGHENLDVTEIYAERDLDLARKIAREIG